MENKGLTFIPKTDKRTCNTTITLPGGGEEVREYINALLALLHSADDDFVGKNDRYYICNIISALLPSPQQMTVLEKAQTSNTQSNGNESK